MSLYLGKAASLTGCFKMQWHRDGPMPKTGALPSSILITCVAIHDFQRGVFKLFQAMATVLAPKQNANEWFAHADGKEQIENSALL